MPKNKTNLPSKTWRRLSAMLEPHARAFHLSHIKRYHAARKRKSKEYDKRNPDFGNLQQKWELPVYLLGQTAAFPIKNDAGKRNGWIQFLTWNGLLAVIAEVRADSRVVSVATGRSSEKQYRIVDKILRRKSQLRNAVVVSMPVLHFRALVYEQRFDGKQKVVPLSSPMAPLRSGAAYSPERVSSRLCNALDHRLAAAQELRENQGRTTVAEENQT